MSKALRSILNEVTAPHNRFKWLVFSDDSKRFKESFKAIDSSANDLSGVD
jgi:hypothetical protein